MPNSPKLEPVVTIDPSSAAAHLEFPASRREFLCRSGLGFGALALASLLGGSRRALAEASSSSLASNALAARAAHRFGRAKSVIFCFMDGGPSHLDTFDPKPAVNQHAGQPLPSSIERVITPMGVSDNPLLASRRTWRQCGESGLPVSDWYPEVGQCIDDICVIRSCWANGLNHVGSVCQMNTGSLLAGRPSLGAWVTYGLGSENENLPAYVVMLDNEKEPPGGNRVWGTGFMPATYQGTRLRSGKEPFLHLHPPATVSPSRQRGQLDFIAELNARHRAERSGDGNLDARIASYELAYRMQSHAPDAVDLSQETAKTQALYGLDAKETAAFGRNCLLARRMVERGVRFVQLYSGSGSQWDAHSKIEQNHTKLCRSTDRPIAGLLTDLKRRGLLDETLVIWGGEFGRTPMSEQGDGRDHNPYGFTMWMAGGGVRGGQAIGATDDFGLRAIAERAHVHDLHATILALLGFDHTKLTYRYNGRDFRLTDNYGKVVRDVIA
jgi:hypothetical protein